MNEMYYTFVGKQHHCPLWDIDVTLSARYHYDKDNPSVATYVSCECPIVQNQNLPPSKQDPKLSIYRFCNMRNRCLASVKFKQQIDVNEDGYSQ